MTEKMTLSWDEITNVNIPIKIRRVFEVLNINLDSGERENDEIEKKGSEEPEPRVPR